MAGCDSPPPETDAGPASDAGVDAGEAVDAGVDAGPPMTDAGADAGPREPTLMELGEAVMTDTAAVSTATAAVPMEERIEGSFQNVSVAASGIDALIGEDARMTLSLTDGAARAFADLRQANLLLRIVAAEIVTLGSSSDASVISLVTALEALENSLTAYRDHVRGIFRERVDLGIGEAPVVRDPMTLTQAVTATGSPSTFAAIVEGSSVETPEATVLVECFGGGGGTSTLTVTNEETGALLGTDSAMDNLTVTFAAPFDDVTPISIGFERPLGMPDMFESCGLSVTTRRRLRGAPVSPSGTNYFNAQSSFSSNSFNIGFEASMTSSFGIVPADVIRSAIDIATLVIDAVAPLTASDVLEIPLSSYARMARQMVHLGPMIDALLASPALSDSSADGLRGAIMGLRTDAEVMVANAPNGT